MDAEREGLQHALPIIGRDRARAAAHTRKQLVLLLEALDLRPGDQKVGDRYLHPVDRVRDQQPFGLAPGSDAANPGVLWARPAPAEHRQDVEGRDDHLARDDPFPAAGRRDPGHDVDVPGGGPSGDVGDGAAPACGNLVNGEELSLWQLHVRSILLAPHLEGPMGPGVGVLVVIKSAAVAIYGSRIVKRLALWFIMT